MAIRACQWSGRGDADDVHVLLVEELAVVLGDVLLVVVVRGRTAWPRGTGRGPSDARFWTACPSQTSQTATGCDRLAFLLHLEDDVDVLLAAAADAEEGDAELVVGALDAGVAGGGQGQRGAGGGGAGEERPAVHGSSTWEGLQRIEE